MVEQIEQGIYRIGVELPQNPLREINSYVLRGEGRDLIIDTGFNRPECLAALQSGIEELGLDMSKTDLFLTHLHSDHAGLASKIASPTSRIYMSTVDSRGMNAFLLDPNGWENQARRFLEEGFPVAEFEQVKANNPGRLYQSSHTLDTLPADDGMVIEVGGIRLECIATPGHTPGHTCLYWPERKILFSGDHVLFNITPNISIWESLPDPLATYFASLGKIYRLPVRLCLPGHRANSEHLQERIQALLHHHRERLEEVVRLIRDNPGIGAYDTARRMTWSIRSKGWEDFPVGQKWFAVGEAMTHLACLVNLGILQKQQLPEGYSYTFVKEIDLEQAILDYFEGRRMPAPPVSGGVR